MEFQLNNNNIIQTEIQETKILSQVNKLPSKPENAKICIDNNTNGNSIQQPIQFPTLQTNQFTIPDDKLFAFHQFSIDKLPIIPVVTNLADSQSTNKSKSRTRTPKVCRVCGKSVLDLRRHLDQCHKELNRLQIVKIVAESKRFRRDLKKSPSKAVRNVLLCPYTNENGEICNRPIVEYKLYQHLKFYHHIHPKSDEGIRLVKHARANPFASKSIFSESTEILNTDSGSEISSNSNETFDFDTEPYQIHLSFPGQTSPVNLPTFCDNNSTLITHSPIQTDSNSSSPITILTNSSSPITILTPSSPIQTPPCIASLPEISCQVVSIGINLAVTCKNLPSITAPQETTCLISRHEDDDILYISIPNLTINDSS